MSPLLTLQHDGHNSLDRIANMLSALDKWNKETSTWAKENNTPIPKSSTPYVVAEHLRSHIKEMRELLDTYYNHEKNKTPEDGTTNR